MSQKNTTISETPNSFDDKQRDYRPSSQEKRLLQNLFESERNGRELLKDGYIGEPVKKSS